MTLIAGFSAGSAARFSTMISLSVAL